MAGKTNQEISGHFTQFINILVGHFFPTFLFKYAYAQHVTANRNWNKEAKKLWGKILFTKKHNIKVR